MTKTEMVKAAVKVDTWAILKRVYGITTTDPSSDKQAELLEELGSYLASLLVETPLTKEELAALLDKMRRTA